MIGAKMKIALLYDLWNEDPVAAAAKEDPATANGNGDGSKRNGVTRKARKVTKKVKKEKTDREEIAEALQKLGHETSHVELDGRPQSLHALAKCDADLVFNLTESFDGDDTKEMNVVAYVDLLGLRYTGAGRMRFLCRRTRPSPRKSSRSMESRLHSLQLRIADALNMRMTFLFR